MAKETPKPVSRNRRAGLKRSLARPKLSWREVIRSRQFAWGASIWVVFTAVVGVLAMWAHQQPRLAVGRIADHTRTVAVGFEVTDQAKTEDLRAGARQRARRVYTANDAVLQEIKSSLERLPKALADADSLEAVEPGIREAFGLTEDALAALKRQVNAGEVAQAWTGRVDSLDRSLRRNPLLDAQTYQLEWVEQNDSVELRSPGGESIVVRKNFTLNVSSESLAEDLRRLALDAGFQGPLLEVVTNRLRHQVKPTFTFDPGATAANQDAAAARVEPAKKVYREREVIYRRGDVLTPDAIALFKQSRAAAQRAFQEDGQPWRTWLERAGVFSLAAVLSTALAGYVLMFCPRIRRNPLRALAMSALLVAMLLLSCAATVGSPSLTPLSAVAPTVFVATICVIAYDQRTALAFGVVQALLVASALNLGVGMIVLTVLGVATAAWQLREIRDRDTLIRAGAVTAVVLTLGMVIAGLVQYPVNAPVLWQTARDAGLAGFGGLLVAGVVLFILPIVERAFDITTGMTLIELRDPKQPLLRQLQQRAPGTYNHSLNVASLGEAAADAIGADGLLTYVGALYHDIGKMNKPDYFVENQTPGHNKHDKLSPAMSLLIIVGHVKDGIELARAREFRLPRPLHHFIEAHHGTTLVEYFYNRARKQAEQEGVGEDAGAVLPEEIEYRYPGPKPRTKEVAIIMLCDAVESAARSMKDPTPSRIDQVVREIANKRLMDGQFDESDLTLRELNIIVETVSKTLAAIYHGRIAYPAGPKDVRQQSASVPPKAAAAPRQGADTELPLPQGASAPNGHTAPATRPVG